MKNPRLGLKTLKIPKVVWHTLISALIMLLLLVVAGLVYVYYFSGGDIQPTGSVASNLADAKPITPTKPSPKSAESASINYLSSPLKPGDEASLSVQTLAGSKCDIGVKLNDKPLKVAGLEAATADDFGIVSWDWRISKTAPKGERDVTVTCYFHKHSAVVVGQLEVK